MISFTTKETKHTKKFVGLNFVISVIWAVNGFLIPLRIATVGHGLEVTAMGCKTAMSCRGLVVTRQLILVLVRFYGLKPWCSGWAALP
jgi:hypothetical protein